MMVTKPFTGNLPSALSMEIHFHNLGKSSAQHIRRLLGGRSDPRDIACVQQLLGQCHNEPPEQELILCAINDRLEGFGVHIIRGRYVDHYHQDIQAAYINTGDTYSATLLLDYETGRVMLTTWGDWVEHNQTEREII